MAISAANNLPVSTISRMATRYAAVKLVMRFAVLLVCVLALFLALSLAYSTMHGYTTWWFNASGLVAVDGVGSGYLHRNWERSVVIITRTDSHPKQSYLVGLDGKNLIHCGEWHAPDFPAFPIGDVNPPCSVFSNGGNLPGADNGDVSSLKTRSGYVEFRTAKGKKVTASW